MGRICRYVAVYRWSIWLIKVRPVRAIGSRGLGFCFAVGAHATNRSQQGKSKWYHTAELTSFGNSARHHWLMAQPGSSVPQPLRRTNKLSRSLTSVVPDLCAVMLMLMHSSVKSVRSFKSAKRKLNSNLEFNGWRSVPALSDRMYVCAYSANL